MKPICFVIMGFGKKSDPLSGLTYNLDQTYKNIIKPAVTIAGYECIRADEIRDSGLIDKTMYALLMQADLVIADITTYNPNALYELGIRHAVRPFSTIIMKEKSGKIPFDLDHNRMFMYTHLGEDIGADEAARCQTELVILIKKVADYKQVDSPLYEFIREIAPPVLPENEFFKVIDELAEKEKHIFAIVEKARKALDDSNFSESALFWKKAHEQVPNEPYFIQQWALTTYKSKKPTEELALLDASNIINKLDPDGQTNDPETLGITGAIYKQLALLKDNVAFLDRAILYYGKCFKIRNDYYTGENYALCLNLKAQKIEDAEEKVYAKVEARKARITIIEHLTILVDSGEVNGKADEKWVYATLSHCHWATGNHEKAEFYEHRFMDAKPVSWEIETYSRNKKLLSNIL
jgi:tetratricopeptide (TPR) repeat protein